MKNISGTVDNTAEAVTLAKCVAAFGPDVLDTLVTNWLKGHEDTFRKQDVQTILKAADLDPSVKTSKDALVAQAATVIAADAAAKVTADEATKALDVKIP